MIKINSLKNKLIFLISNEGKSTIPYTWEAILILNIFCCAFFPYFKTFRQTVGWTLLFIAALGKVGQAITKTTITAFVCGIILFCSNISSIAYVGLLFTLTLTMALIADFFITPVVIFIIKPFGKEFDTLVERHQMGLTSPIDR